MDIVEISSGRLMMTIVLPADRVSDDASRRRRRGAAARRGGGARCRARGSPRTPLATGREFRSAISHREYRTELFVCIKVISRSRHVS